MTRAILLIGFLMMAALWCIAAQLASISQRSQTGLDARREAAGPPDDEGDSSRIVAELTRVHKSVAALRDSVDAALRGLFSISRALDGLAPEEAPKPDDESWQVDEQRRHEIRAVAKDLGPGEFVAFIAHRHRLPADDPWVLSMLTLREGVGLEAVVTALRRRDAALGSEGGQP